MTRLVRVSNARGSSGSQVAQIHSGATRLHSSCVDNRAPSRVRDVYLVILCVRAERSHIYELISTIIALNLIIFLEAHIINHTIYIFYIHLLIKFIVLFSEIARRNELGKHLPSYSWV